MSSATEAAFQDSDVRLLRQMMAKIERLEEQAVGLAPGLIIPYAAPALSSKWSENHIAAMGVKWTRHYQCNDLNESNVIEDRAVTANNGQLKADSTAALPLMGQPGGLSTEGSYSLYFPGKEHSRVEIPLLSELTTNFSAEILFKPESLGQQAVLLYNGTSGTNGWGLAIGNPTNTGVGSNLLFLHSSGVVVNTEIILTAEDWHYVSFTWLSGVLWVDMWRLNHNTKAIEFANKSFTPTIVKPTGGSFLGSASATSTAVFKGWIDEFSTYNGVQNISEEIVGSQYDRAYTSLIAAAPPGFIVPDATAVGRAKYDRLFKAIGTIYGAGDGSSTFNLPDLRGRFILPTNTAALGAKGGEETHVLSAVEMPAHQHILNYGVIAAIAGGPEGQYVLGGAGFSVGTTFAGSNAAHNNMPPYLVTNCLLKT